jgi:hypothetical protein
VVNTVYFGNLDTVCLPTWTLITTSIPCEVRTKTVPSPFASFVRLRTRVQHFYKSNFIAATSDLNYSLVYAIQFGFSVCSVIRRASVVSIRAAPKAADQIAQDSNRQRCNLIRSAWTTATVAENTDLLKLLVFLFVLLQ